MREGRLIVASGLMSLLAACGGSLDAGDDSFQGTDFVFQSGDWPDTERFVVRVSNAHVREMARAELSLPLAQRRLFPNGRLHAGHGGHNTRWSWHLRDLHYGAVAIDVCDGRPSMVEADLSYWLDRVERFCPWSARVVAEL
jgi:hypothetical protein